MLTMDETWLYHYDFETKQPSIEWGKAAHPASKIRSEKFRFDF